MNHALTVEQASEKYGLSVSAIRCLIKTGRLIPNEQGDQTLLTPEAFENIDLFSTDDVAAYEQACPGFADLVAAHKGLVGIVAEIQAKEADLA